MVTPSARVSTRTRRRRVISSGVRRISGMIPSSSRTAKNQTRPSGCTSRRTGFGAVLIEQRVPYELMGAGALTFAPGGVQCEIAFPLLPIRSVLQTDAG